MKKNTIKVSDIVQKTPYIAPRCGVIEVEKQSFICTSLHPKETPEESDWEDDENIDGGDGGIDF